MQGFKDFLTESSLSRIWQHVENDSTAFGVISAERQDLSDNENKKRTKDLEKRIRGAGFGFIKLKGAFREEQTGELREEISFFIPVQADEKEDLRKSLIKWGRRYDQDAIIYKDDSHFEMIGTNRDVGVGKSIIKFKSRSGRGNITLASSMFQDFFSTLAKGSDRGKKFIFTVKESKTPKTQNAKILESHGQWDSGWYTIIEEPMTVS